MSRRRKKILGFIGAGAWWFFEPCLAQSIPNEDEWTWHDASGNELRRADLEQVLRLHEEWVDSRGAAGRLADLSRANLFEADLRDKDLSRANLKDVNLIGARLEGAIFQEADLSDADLREAQLFGAQMWNAVLTGADFRGATGGGAYLAGAVMTGADLRNAVFTKAWFSGADLSRADLRGARFEGADFANTILSGAVYEPAASPPADFIATAKGLDDLEYRRNSSSLVKLRSSLKEAGYWPAERQVTAALRRHDAPWWETLLFDWTCKFGANAARPLRLISLIFLFSTVLYRVCLTRTGRGRLLLVTSKQLNQRRPIIHEWRLREMRLSRSTGQSAVAFYARRENRALQTALLFSLMSTFNIGFKEFNFGRWIRLLQPRDFDIKAVGWARVVSGIQALVSVGLLALSLLSYFGRPFEI